VSIIVLNLNGAALLRTLLSSFARFNRYSAIDIIVVDHHSSDDSIAVLEAWQPQLPLTIVRCLENFSFSFSCNRAAEIATGEFLLLLNSDVEFTGDIVGRMVGATQDTGGAVGLKLYKNRVGGTAGNAVHHIGVRFKWYFSRRFFGNYNAIPVPGDEGIQAASAHFPAVTAALMMCRRDDYLALGGCSELYAYGYEDIDLCLKYRFGYARPVISLNDVSASHGDGRTRFVQISKPKHRIWQKYNAGVFKRRCGYAVRREAALKLFTDDGSYWGRRANIGIITASDRVWAKIKPLVDAVASVQGWSPCRLRPGGHGYDMRDVDLLIAVDLALDMEGLRHRSPAMLAMAWNLEESIDEESRDLSVFDCVLAGDANLADALERAVQMPVAVIEPSAEGARALLEAIVHNLAVCHRFAIKWAPGGDRDFAERVARLLRRAGHPSRIDPPAQWYATDTIRDDVVLLLPGAACAPQSGAINLAVGQNVGGPDIDGHLPLAEPGDFVAALMDSISVLHSARMRGPTDPPLRSTARPSGLIFEGWGGRQDPLRELLDRE